MKSLRTSAHAYLPELIMALFILTTSLLIIKDERFIFVFSAASICVVFAFLALKFPTVPLHLLLIFGILGEGFLYDAYHFRWGGVVILPTDPVYAVIFVTMVLATIRDPGVVTRWWSHLRGGIFVGLVLLILVVFGYIERGYSALAEFRYQFVPLFIPFYCLCSRLSTRTWLRFLRWTFWLSALVVAPLVVMSLMEGARLFSPSHRILASGTHLWLMISLFLLAVPGLVAKGLAQSLIAWLIGGAYVFLILSDGHRSVWLASAAILVTIWLLDRGDFRGLRIVSAVLCFAVLPVIALVVIEGHTPISEFIVSRTAAYFSPMEDGTANWRLWLWGGAWEIFTENPFMGIGLGNYFDDVWLLLTGEREGPGLHNFYISLLFKGGIALAVVYGWYMFNIGWSLVRLRKNVSSNSDVFITLGIAILVGMLAFQIAYNLSEVFMVFTGALLALGLTSTPRDQRT